MVIVDCDVHNYWADADVLLPYLDSNWRDRFLRGEKPGNKGAFPHAHRPYYHPEGFKRADINPKTTQEWIAATSKHCDDYKIDYAVLTADEAVEASTLSDPYYAAGLISAYNDYMIDVWLPADSRFRGSLVINPNEPLLAAQEIRRVGDDSRIIQVLSTEGAQLPLGQPYYHPIYEACTEMGLPFAIHLGGHGGVNGHPIAHGPATFFWEAHTLLPQGALTHTASMIAHGVFEKYPDLKFIIVECSVSIFVPILWRLDSEYKALNKETPWLKMLPSEYFRKNIRLTSQPLEQPENIEHLWAVLEALHAEDTLMFASDFPHWDFDDFEKLNLPEAIKENVKGLTAMKTYTRLTPPKNALAAE